MTTNDPGSVDQQPLYGCTSCYEECTWPASDLRVHDGECWCDPCWDGRADEFPGQPDWTSLDQFTPALQVECERLRKDAARYQWLRDKSESLHSFYLSTPMWMTGVRFRPENVDSTIDAAMQGDKS